MTHTETATLAAAPAPAPTSDRDFVVSRVIAAPPDLVWRAWTDPALIAHWWGPAGLQATDCTIDLRIGGAFHLTLRGPDGAAYPCHGRYREIVAPERLAYEGEPGDGSACGAGAPPGARVIATFQGVEGGTLLTVETRFPTATACRAAIDNGYAVGWPASFERLSAHLSALPG